MARPLLPLCFLLGCATSSAATPAPEVPKNTDSGRPSASQGRPFVSPHSYEYYVRAEVLAQRGDFAAAVSAYDQALAGAEVDAYLLSRYARALDHQGLADDATAALFEALALSPNDPAVHTELADYYARHGDIPKAFGEYERALSLAPHALAPALGLADLLDKQGAPKRAEATLQRFVVDNPEFGVQKAKAALALALHQQQAEEAKNAVDQLRTLAQVSPETLAETATLLLNQDKALAAALLLQPAPEHPALLQVRLRAYLAAQWIDQARDLLVRFPEESLGGFPTVAEAFLAVGLPDRALESASAAKLTHRGSPALVERAAMLEAKALLDLGRPVEAAAMLRSISNESTLASEAMQLRVHALQQAGLPALADVVAGSRTTVNKP